MYNVSAHLWESASYEDEVIRWAKAPENAENPQAVYVLADLELSKLTGQSGAADAVFLMEQAAKKNYEPAAFAMAQLFHYGWGVEADLETALKWYGVSANLGNEKAAKIAEELKKKQTEAPGKHQGPEKPKKRGKEKTPAGKRGRSHWRIIIAAAALLVIIGIIAAVLQMSSGASVDGVVVGDNTELIEPATVEEFNDALSNLIAQYDDELVISGQQSTNRLILAFEGDGIDLSAFPAATVIADEDNYVVIQFETEEDAAACLETLMNTDGVLFVEEDSYSTSSEGSTGTVSDGTQDAALSAASDADLSTSGVPYTSSYTGYTYYTWGAEYLGLDRLSAWLMTQDTQEVVVAVVDTGTAVPSDLQDRVLEGTDITGNSDDGRADTNGHGTHVSGIILQCTQGLDVQVLPVRVFGSEDTTTSSYVISGIRYAIEAGVDVINLSLGSSEHSSGKEYYIQEAVAQGIVVVCAAGNDAADTADNCSAHMEEIIVVGAIDADGTVCSFSNYGDSVDVAAPGYEIISYAPDGEMAVMSGTSQATPHISALAAMMLTVLTEKTPAQIESYIENACIDAGDADYYGAGIPWAAYLAE